MKRVALLLSGHLRTFSAQHIRNIHSLTLNTNCDIFVSTHYTRDHSSYNEDRFSRTYTHDDLREIFDTLPVRTVEIDHDTDWEKDEKELGRKVNYCYKFWKKVYNAWRMCTDYAKENGITYDYIIRSRPDVLVKERIDFNSLPSLDDKLLIGFGTTLGYPDDMFAIAAPNVMEHYCDIKKVLDHDLLPHKVVGYTLKTYPMWRRVQISIVRFNHRIEKFDNIPIVSDNGDGSFELMHPRPDTEPVPPVLSTTDFDYSVFNQYKNAHVGEVAYVFGSGPSLNNFEEQEPGIYLVGNNAHRLDRVKNKTNYLFFLYRGYKRYYSNTDTVYGDFCNMIQTLGDHIPKFCCLGMDVPTHDRYIPVIKHEVPNVEFYRVTDNPKNAFIDIASEPWWNFSIVYGMTQFAAFAGCKKIYLVGCDCTEGYFFNEKYDGENFHTYGPYAERWIDMKRYMDKYYPNVEIVSINPVKLKNLFPSVTTGVEEKVPRNEEEEKQTPISSLVFSTHPEDLRAPRNEDKASLGPPDDEVVGESNRGEVGEKKSYTPYNLTESLSHLNDYEKKVFSQNGEDGILDQIFRVIGPTNRYYVEFGVENGSECNTRYLREQRGFHGLMMDGQYGTNMDIGLFHHFITAENINEIFGIYGVPDEFDLLSIDVDFNDWYMWNALSEKYRPRVVVIEYNADHPPSADVLVPYNSQDGWDGSDYFGASILAFDKLAKKKGYTIIASDKKGVNLFFLRNDLVPPGFNKTLSEIYFPSSYGDDGRGKGHRPDPYNRPYITAELVLEGEEKTVGNMCMAKASPYNDRFDITVKEVADGLYSFRVKRIDKEEGWGQDLSLMFFNGGGTGGCETVRVGRSFLPEKVFMHLSEMKPER